MTDAPTTDQIKSLFEKLATAPRRLFELCSGQSPVRMQTPIAPGRWSPLQIIQHLVGCDREALLPRIEKMLAEDHPVLPVFDQDQWMRIHGSVRDQKTVRLIDEWARLREKSSILLFDLSAEQWARTGQHEERGEISIFKLCGYFADHDESHIKQIYAVLKRTPESS